MDIPKEIDTSSLNITWQFGDGNSASGQTVKHIYKSTVIHKVKFTVEDSSKPNQSVSIEKDIVISEDFPIIRSAPEIKIVYFTGANVQLTDKNGNTVNLVKGKDFDFTLTNQKKDIKIFLLRSDLVGLFKVFNKGFYSTPDGTERPIEFITAEVIRN